VNFKFTPRLYNGGPLYNCNYSVELDRGEFLWLAQQQQTCTFLFLQKDAGKLGNRIYKGPTKPTEFLIKLTYKLKTFGRTEKNVSKLVENFSTYTHVLKI